MQRIIPDVHEPEPLVDRHAGEPEHQRDVDLPVPQHLQRLDGVLFEQGQLQARMLLSRHSCRPRHHRGQRGGIGSQPNPPRLQPDLRRQLVGRRVDTSHDLGGFSQEKHSDG
ncbi:hypothetical protein C8D87_10715 [Lentzea atacamensis]|uniref:Uncharacterized protein n=1 Tax=Lentzea atacamensis TaxID=531938 RepID=A0ABX9E5I8_9PSEU|nr:hypothetical protein C8D87_10715 [Lentzea atacamensis]